MKRFQGKYSKNTSTPSLGKKLFVAVSFLVVSAALIVFVSVARYRLTIKGEAVMPQAATMQAQINLAQSLESHASAGDKFLVNLLPDDSASQFYQQDVTVGAELSQEVLNHKIDLSIYNKKIETTTGENGETVITGTEPSQTDMRYNLRIYTQNRLPLAFVLLDKQSNKTYASEKNADGSYYFYEYVNETVNGVSASVKNEVQFDLNASGDITHRYSIYVGWDNTGVSTQVNDISYRKEVEILELRALVENVPAGMHPLPQDQISNVMDSARPTDSPATSEPAGQ